MSSGETLRKSTSSLLHFFTSKGIEEVAEFSGKLMRSVPVVVAITSIYLHNATRVASQTSAVLLCNKM